MPADAIFEAYKLLHAAAPRSERLEQVKTLLRWEIEQDGAMIYADPQTGELRLGDALPAPERPAVRPTDSPFDARRTAGRQAMPRRATRGAVVTFRKQR